MKKNKVNKSLVKKAGKLSIIEGSFSAIMDGFGNRYITPYALALGVSNFFIAMLSTLPNFLGNAYQLMALKAMKKKSRRKIVSVAVFIQAVLWLLIIGLGVVFIFVDGMKNWISFSLLIIYTFLITAGAYSSPAWNSWMRDLIFVHTGKYFGVRNRVAHISVILSMFIASFILSLFSESKILIGFFIIFFIAFLGRLISFFLLTRQYEPAFQFKKEAYFSFADFVKKMLFNNFGRFVLFVSLVSFSVSIAGPFFAVYMLKELGFSYFQYTFVTIGAVITTVFFIPRWGRFSDKFGNLEVMKITSLFTPLLPLLWALSFMFKEQIFFVVIYLFFLELFAGYLWSGFNLSASLFIYDAVTKEKMAYCVAYFNIINAFGAFLGAVLGGIIASFDITFGLNTILFVFILSGILRAGVVFLMKGKIKEVKEVDGFSIKGYLRNEMHEVKTALLGLIGFWPIRISSHF